MVRVAAPCQVCEETAAKYKCPTCVVPYCSVNCFRSHRDHCIPPVVESAVDQGENSGGGNNDAAAEYRFKTADTVPKEKLDLLGKSETLKNLLRNPHLQNFLKTIDSSDNPPRLMRKAMYEPLFVEFVDECLKVVDPSQQELTDQQVLEVLQDQLDSQE